MNRFRLLAIATTVIFVFALTAAAQQPAARAGDSAKGTSSSEHASVPTAETQLTFLTGKLDLTSDEQSKIKPILQELHDATVKLVQDDGLSHDERMSKIRDSHYVADRKIRVILNDDQKTKLDQIEQEPHPELHGTVTGAHN
jgi:periplasmic protein CpxP/Spy